MYKAEELQVQIMWDSGLTHNPVLQLISTYSFQFSPVTWGKGVGKRLTIT